MSHSPKEHMPDLSEAWALLKNSNQDERKIRHGIMVARGALRLGIGAAASGLKSDPMLLACGGLLHDIAKKHKDHALAGKAMLENMGWNKVALAVGSHTVLPSGVLRALDIFIDDAPIVSPGAPIPPSDPAYNDLSTELFIACSAIYLADKFFADDALVPLQHRFDRVRRRFAGDEPSLSTIAHREKIAFAVSERYARILGENPAEILIRPVSHQLEKALTALAV